MRADFHDGPEHSTLQSEAGYIDARPQADRSTKLSCNARPHHTLRSKNLTRRIHGCTDLRCSVQAFDEVGVRPSAALKRGAIRLQWPLTARTAHVVFQTANLRRGVLNVP